MLKPVFALLVTVCLLLFSGVSQASTAWESYKARFMMPDGRIVDTANGNISHTEGQGFAMLMAVSNNDKAAFDTIWQWTNNTLRNRDTGLFYWRYNPALALPIADKNNATDGDTLIAWALLQADSRWHNQQYGKASDEITKALLAQTVIDFAGYTVMLPGKEGFNHNSEVVLNPSYFIFPAWKAFALRSHLQVWQTLIDDGQRLLGKMGQGNLNLPPDWTALQANGDMAPANGWPARMSYDAIRIPLYVYWYSPRSPLLLPWRIWFSQYSRGQTPAWVNVVTGETAPYMMTGGLLAIRDLAMGMPQKEPQITAGEDYYSASLKMLVWIAYQ